MRRNISAQDTARSVQVNEKVYACFAGYKKLLTELITRSYFRWWERLVYL